MKRIALVSPRYGMEVTSGPARYARQLAERLVKRYEVDVLTTKAVDDATWRNWYVRDAENIRGVTVRRFPVEHERALNFESYSKTYLEECQADKRSMGVEKIWLEKHGPYAPGCIEYIRRHKQDYDVILFAGCMHYLTVAGMAEASEKSILIPLLEGDSPYLQFLIFEQLFTMPRGFVFLTDEERMFVRKRFKTQGIPCEVMGTGVNVPDQVDPAAFCHKYNIRSRYIVYVGRIDEEKDCPMLFHYFSEYQRRNPRSGIKLVLMGREECRVPEHEDIRSLGYVSEQDKFNGVAGAEVLVIPSQQENLPDALLTAMAMGVPVLVNGACETLRDHCIRSNAGLYYQNFFEFEGALNVLLGRTDVYNAMSQNALNYVMGNYEWDIIVERFVSLFGKALS
ncbi:MAG: glycosyltransferase family 4 protein [Ruminococcus sp.]|nr:glycosyltransferase family 4 protein [Ruminococcus sp.]